MATEIQIKKEAKKALSALKGKTVKEIKIILVEAIRIAEAEAKYS